MIKKMMLGVFMIGGFFLFAQNGWCGTNQGDFFLSPMIGWHVFDKDQNLDNSPSFGIGAGYQYTDHWGLEAMFNYTPSEIEDSGVNVDVFPLRIDVLYSIFPEWKWNPYVAAGLGTIAFNPDRGSNDIDYLADYGLGLKYSVNDAIALRGDVRNLISFNHTQSNLLYSLGLVYYFGGEEKVVSPPPAPPVIPIEKVVPAPIKEKMTIDMRVQFDFDKADIKPQYHDNIKKLADFMNQYPDIDAEIEGHTCSMGSSDYNKGLSQRRAESVKAYMIKNFGIDSARLTTVGYGESRPIADNNTRDGRIQNRRVHAIVSEEVVVEKPAP